ncbi:MAG: DUF2236 domain-containing protein [Pirellulales bacterium]|nr:DUF2236 domain-containing protein [Pirellulales bacterium]
MVRSPALAKILTLDPRRDHQEIVFLSSAYEFPWDFERSLELALLRTFCVPTISAILDCSGEFAQRAAKRYDDTELILAEIVEHGYDSPRGGAALRRMNEIHGRFKIQNDDYLYVLSTFIYEPIRWIARFGWRPLTEQERLGSFWFWYEIGTRMGIRDIPADFDTFDRFNRGYERDRIRPCETNRRVGAATRALFLSWFPRYAHPVAGAMVDALVDDVMREALSYRAPLPGLRPLLHGLLRLRAGAVRWLPPRRHPRLLTQVQRRSYPRGYEIDQLGPPS